MNKILSCVDPRGNTDAVIDWSAWAAQRLAAPLEFLHVLERPAAGADARDYSGAIGADAQDNLLHLLSEQDAQHSRAAREAGRILLAHARSRAAAAGADRLDARMRHGGFVDTVLELQDAASLLVLGEHHHTIGPERVRGEHHVEQVIRGVDTSVLVASADAFVAPRCALIAFDGSPPARRALQAAAGHPLLAGLPMQVVRVGDDGAAAQRQLHEAQALLARAGIAVQTRCVAGTPQQALPALCQALAPALLVMGAFGHSRLRQWLLGSTTSTLLRVSAVPVLVLR